jgi:hypothetical protein
MSAHASRGSDRFIRGAKPPKLAYELLEDFLGVGQYAGYRHALCLSQLALKPTLFRVQLFELHIESARQACLRDGVRNPGPLCLYFRNRFS